MWIFGKVALGIAGAAVAGTGVLLSEGLIRVEVIEKRPEAHHIYVLAPAVLVPVGMHFVPKEKLAEASCEIRPWLPAIRAAVDGLRHSQDFTIAEVNEPEEKVRVVKKGGSLIVDVRDHDNTVFVAAPIRAISSAIEQLAAAEPASQP